MWFQNKRQRSEVRRLENSITGDSPETLPVVIPIPPGGENQNASAYVLTREACAHIISACAFHFFPDTQDDYLIDTIVFPVLQRDMDYVKDIVSRCWEYLIRIHTDQIARGTMSTPIARVIAEHQLAMHVFSLRE